MADVCPAAGRRPAAAFCLARRAGGASWPGDGVDGDVGGLRDRHRLRRHVGQGWQRDIRVARNPSVAEPGCWLVFRLAGSHCVCRARVHSMSSRGARNVAIPTTGLACRGIATSLSLLAMTNRHRFPISPTMALTVRSPLHRNRLPAPQLGVHQHRRVDAAHRPPSVQDQRQLPPDMQLARRIEPGRRRRGMR